MAESKGATSLSVGAWGRVCALTAASAVAGCSAGEALPPEDPWWIQAGPGVDVPTNEGDAARFLEAATFGPTREDLGALMYSGFDAWIEHQMSLPVSRHRPPLEARASAGETVNQSSRQEVWWARSVRADDQLRQRVAFALSEIFVVSDRSAALNNYPVGLAHYYDTLLKGAFGSYRELMEDVTKSPVMGNYLSHLRNQKGDPATGIRPDENYARELMQLFAIGLIELSPDGTPRLDLDGHEIPTYSQTDIEELSRVMTGWTYAGAEQFKWGTRNFLAPMEAWPEYHDDGAKTILGGIVIPSGLTPEEDLDVALDGLFAHANVAPFVSLRLIQRLVTSNPSPAYVGRVAAVFEDNGEGERGQLGAVVKAILMDAEARTGHETAPDSFGKLREPLVRLVGLWRLFNASPQTGRFLYSNPQNDLGQAALRSPSVFNFFYPSYAAPGLIEGAGLLSPEFQITTHSTITSAANEYRQRIYLSYPGYSGTNDSTVTLRLGYELGLAGDPEALVDHLNLYLMAGQMSAAMHATLVGHVTSVDMEAGNRGTGMQRVLDAIYLIITSPEGAQQL